MFKTQCVHCRVMKDKFNSGRKDKEGLSIFTEGEDGFRWVGESCPDCAYDRASKSFDPDPKTDRKCRHCSQGLRVSQYFYCAKCADDLPDDLGHYSVSAQNGYTDQAFKHRGSEISGLRGRGNGEVLKG